MSEKQPSNPTVRRSDMLVVIGVRLYKDGLTEGEVKKIVKDLTTKSDAEVELEFNKCFGLPS